MDRFQYVPTDQGLVNHNFDRLVEFLVERDRTIKKLEETVNKLVVLAHVHQKKAKLVEGEVDGPKPSET